MSGDSFLEELAGVVGPDHVLVDPEVRAAYEADWTGRWRAPCRAVVRPSSTAEVSAVLAACSAAEVGVVPQGGNTGLVGGSVPQASAQAERPVVLSLRRLTGAVEVDPAELLLRAGAGTTLADAQATAARVGLALGVDLAARDSATLGGLVATNAGGIHVVRHGSMRRRLAGLEAVLADGTVVSRMGGLWKDNVGWDLPSLLAGSEGTLAVVTAVAVRLVPDPPCRVTALLALPGSSGAEAAAHVVARLPVLLRRLDGLEAVEFVDRAAMELVVAHEGVAPPPGGGSTAAWLLVEAGGNRDLTPDLADAVGDLSDEVAVASDAGPRQRLWAYRERVPEAVAARGIPHKLDASVPVARVPEFLAAIPEVVAQAFPSALPVCFGHLGDGNVHVNVLGPEPDDMAVDDAVYDLALELGGSISAEHGIGVAKLHKLAMARSAAELDVARRVKAALDPKGILNPGVLIA